MTLPMRSSSPSGIIWSSSPPIPIPRMPQEQKPVIDLTFAENILFITSRKKHRALWDRLEKSISAIDPDFHELEEDEIVPIVERIIRVFHDTTKIKNKYVSRGGQLTRSIYFDQKEKTAYVYLRKDSKFNGPPKFLKVIWNDGIPTVEQALKIPSIENDG